MSTVLELKKVTVQFASSRPVLRNVSIEVKRGERIAVIGPSGQGKTVLLKVLASLLKPTEGEVFCFGENIHAVSRERRQELMLQMGMLFQKNALFDSISNIDNIRFPLRERHWPEEKVESTAHGFLREVGIDHAAQLYPDEISGGMQKRLGIARALALNPQVLFYDDPTAGLDPITSRKIVDLIVGLQEKFGSTVVAVTNDMNRAYQMAHRIWLVAQGSVLDAGTPDETRNHPDPRLQQFIHGRPRGPLTESP